ncbi:MAG TPA: hypothetical protein DEA73_03520 [Peptococcaceae bacterium]|nr:hypothetical protein [Peptococcaceae bacterium]
MSAADIQEEAVQCGFCTPVYILTATPSLLPKRTKQDVEPSS